MNETTVTLVGRVGQPPILRTGSRGDWTSFTLATNPRYKQGDAWTDGPTSWFTVNADGDLAHHVIESIEKGQQVIVQGTLSVRDAAQQDGTQRRYVNVQAAAVGPDLRWGTARFEKAVRRSAPVPPTSPQPAAPPQQDDQRPVGDWGAMPGGGEQPRQEPVPQAGWAPAGFGADEDTPF